MRIAPYLFSTLLAASLLSCGDDPFSQVADIELPDHTSRPTLVLHLINGDTMITPFVDVSQSIDDGRLPTARDARLLLSVEGQAPLSLAIRSGEDVEIPLQRPVADQRLAYGVEVEMDGFPGPISASQTMPTPPDITNVRFTPNGSTSFDGFEQDSWEVTISDPVGEDNFYLIRSLSPDGVRCGGQLQDSCILIGVSERYSNFGSSPDPLMQDASDFGFLLNDDTFDGQNYTIRLNAENYSDFHILDVYSLTEDGFRYFETKAAYDRSQDNPFSEPANVHENIRDGYGIFIVSHRQRIIRQDR